jgi:hypothetical protein
MRLWWTVLWCVVLLSIGSVWALEGEDRKSSLSNLLIEPPPSIKDGLLSRVLPAGVLWKTLVSVIFLEFAVLFTLLIPEMPKWFSVLKSSILAAVIPASLILVDTYLELVKWEQLHEPGKGHELVEGIALNTRRFRAQRNFYLSLVALVQLFVCLYAERTANRLNQLLVDHDKVCSKLRKIEKKE